MMGPYIQSSTVFCCFGIIYGHVKLGKHDDIVL